MEALWLETTEGALQGKLSQGVNILIFCKSVLQLGGGKTRGRDGKSFGEEVL